MMPYSVQSSDSLFVNKGYRFLSFAKTMSKSIDSKYSKYCQNLLNNAKLSATDPRKTVSKKAIQKTAEPTGDLIGNKIAYRITKV